MDWMVLALQHAGCGMTWQVLLDQVRCVSHDCKSLRMVWIRTWWFLQALETKKHAELVDVIRPKQNKLELEKQYLFFVCMCV
jgi:hypothetical protein